MSVFIQWNMRGLQANREELGLLLSQYHPTAVSIQETLLHSNKTASFLSQITHLSTTIALNSKPSEIRLKTSTSNVNPIIWRRIIIRSLLNSGMPSRNHTTVRLARMTSTTRCLNTFHPMMLTLCSKL